MQVNREALSSKLQQLNCSQQTIESVSAWCVFYRKDAKNVVAIWEDELHRAPPDRKLALLYLGNHILQESRKKGKEFADEFVKVLPKALRAILSGGNEKTKKSVERVVGVWEERRVFSSKEIRHIKDALQGTERLSRQDSVSNEEKKKLQIAGSVVDVLLEVDSCSKRVAEWSQRSMNSFRVDLESSSLQDLSESQESLVNYSHAIQSELQARKKALNSLKSLVSQQEDAIVRLERQLSVCNGQNTQLESRIAKLRNSTQQTYQHTFADTVPGMSHSAGVYQVSHLTNQAAIPISPATLQSVAAVLPGLSNLASWNNASMSGVPGVSQVSSAVGQPPPSYDPSAGYGVVSYTYGSAPPVVMDPRAGSAMPQQVQSQPIVEPVAQQTAEGMKQYDPEGQVGDYGDGDGDDLAAVAAQLASSDQSAVLLAQALACLPQEERDKFGLGVAEVLHQQDDDEPYDPDNPY